MDCTQIQFNIRQGAHVIPESHPCTDPTHSRHFTRTGNSIAYGADPASPVKTLFGIGLYFRPFHNYIYPLKIYRLLGVASHRYGTAFAVESQKRHKRQ